ncbi:MAG: outer membrane beta-barrel protein [Bacteroides sp.]|nr:outer membrane beta-barrel protein [Bacteroides sp.]
MKRITTILVLSLCAVWLMAADLLSLPADTIIYLKDKKIEVRESNSRIKVSVYEQDEQGGYTESEKVFEGHYRDGKSYENRVHSRNLVFTQAKSKGKERRRYHIDPHWAGFSIGFANLSDSHLNINDVDGVTLNSGKSLEYNLNFWEEYVAFSRFPVAIVTGMGLRFTRYNLDGIYLSKIDRETVAVTPGRHMDLRKSKLHITSLTIPLLLEWQTKGSNWNEFYLSAGVVGVVKLGGSSRVRYRDEQGKRHKIKEGGMYLRPVSFDLQVQGGIGWFGVYAKYSPLSAFEKNKGPEVHPVTLGVSFNF